MGLCSSCRAPLDPNSPVCSICGNVESRSVASVPEEEAARIFVGKNYEYYWHKWAVTERRASKQSWNWAAFVFGFAWMAYRKMYLYSLIFIGVMVLESAFELAFHFPYYVGQGVNLAIGVMFGVYGNHAYRLHVDRSVLAITAGRSVEASRSALERQGGTSVVASVGFTVLLFALLFGVAVLGEGLGGGSSYEVQTVEDSI